MSNAASIGSKTFHDLATNHTYRSETDIVQVYPNFCKIWIFHNHSISKKRPVKALMVTIIVISSVLACSTYCSLFWKTHMQTAQFWQLIDQSRQQASAENQTHAEALSEVLHPLSVTEIIAFEHLFTRFFHEAYDWKLWAAAYLIHGGCSDDGFMDFRAWLIAQGETTYQNVLANPDLLAEMVEDEDDLYVLESQDIWSVAVYVYQDKTGSDDMPNDDETEFPTEPKGKTWEEEDLAELLPSLYQKFE